MKGLRFALSILTTIPVGKLDGIDEKLWQASVSFYPLCGYLIAFVSVLPVMLISKIFFVPAIIQAIAIVISLTLYTGGIHLDGFADCCDALLCSASRGKRLQILHDSRVGTFGTVGLILLLVSKISAITVLVSYREYFAIFSMIVLARFFIVVLAKYGQYFQYEAGMGKEIIGRISYTTLLTALAFTMPCLVFRINILIISVLLFFAVLFLSKRSKDKLGGISGDILGAGCELCETLGLVLLTLG